MIRKNRERGTVEFVLKHDTAQIPHLMGSWDGWLPQGIPMARQRGEAPTWKTEVQLAPGEHQFRYRIGDDWFNDPSSDRSVDNGMGGENSVVIVEETPKRAERRSHQRMSRRNVDEERQGGGSDGRQRPRS